MIVVLLFGLALVLWVLNLVRRDRLYVGYGVFLILCFSGAVAIMAVPQLLTLLTRVLGGVSRAEALILVTFAFVLFMLIYTLSQVTIVSNRVAALVQALAVERAEGETTRGAEEAAGTIAERDRRSAP